MNILHILLGTYLTFLSNHNLTERASNYLEHNHSHLKFRDEYIKSTTLNEPNSPIVDDSKEDSFFDSLTSYSSALNNKDWLEWKQTYNRTYDYFEIVSKSNFVENKRKINEFNNELKEELGFELGLNDLADKGDLEMSYLRGYRPRKNHRYESSYSSRRFLSKLLSDKSVEIPDEVDWRKVPGRVSQVKNQGSCGSCWAFSAVGLLEGQEMVRKDRLVNGSSELIELSEQNVVDCDKKDYGCQGGLMSDALTFVKEEGGIDSEESYPYEGRKRNCRFRKDKVAFSDNGFAILPVGDEEKLKQVVATYGPVSVAIDASSFWFQLYRKGVYYNKHCKNKENQLDHGVLVVGYGTDPKKGDYWIVKNSWGPHWGEKGYIKMARNRSNNCGIATTATIATF